MQNMFCWDGGALTVPGPVGWEWGSSLVGVALSGNVPLQTVVSRGVVPVSPSLKATDWGHDEWSGELTVHGLQAPSLVGVFSPEEAFGRYCGHDNFRAYAGLQIQAKSGGAQQRSPPGTFEFWPCRLPRSSAGTPTMRFFIDDKTRVPAPAHATVLVNFFCLESEAAQDAGRGARDEGQRPGTIGDSTLFQP